MQQAIYGSNTRAISLLRRNLQAIYEDKLIALATVPQAGAPPDAQSLARLELERLASSAAAQAAHAADDATRAHLTTLAQKADAALRPAR